MCLTGGEGTEEADPRRSRRARLQLPPIRQALLSPSLDYPKHPDSKLEPLPDLLLTESLLSKLLIFTEHKDTIRRGGVLSTLK